MEELTYLDLVILKKINADSTVEKFGGAINTSFFDTANILGSLKVKGLIEIESSIGGRSSISLTHVGRDVLEAAQTRSKGELDTLDRAILHALAGGLKELDSLQSALNIRHRDLAFHLDKLHAFDYLDYEVRSGKVFITMTEKGFNATGKRPSEMSHPKESSGKQAKLGKGREAAPPWAKGMGKKKKELSVDEIADIIGSPKDAKEAKARHEKEKEKPKYEPVPSPEERKMNLRRKMLFSKIEYYVRSYWFYFIVLAVMAILLVYAIVVVMGIKERLA